MSWSSRNSPWPSWPAQANEQKYEFFASFTGLEDRFFEDVSSCVEPFRIEFPCFTEKDKTAKLLEILKSKPNFKSVDLSALINHDHWDMIIDGLKEIDSIEDVQLSRHRYAQDYDPSIYERGIYDFLLNKRKKSIKRFFFFCGTEKHKRDHECAKLSNALNLHPDLTRVRMNFLYFDWDNFDGRCVRMLESRQSHEWQEVSLSPFVRWLQRYPSDGRLEFFCVPSFYDEYSSRSPSLEGYSDLIAWLLTNPPQNLHSVVLLGDNADNKRRENEVNALLERRRMQANLGLLPRAVVSHRSFRDPEKRIQSQFGDLDGNDDIRRRIANFLF